MGGGVGHFGGGGAGALGVDKGEQLHIADFLDQLQRCLKILLGFAGEAHDDVAGEGHAGDLFPRVADQFFILPDIVMAVHLLQQSVAAGLHRQVDMLAQVRLRGDGVDQLMAGILGVAGHKADLVIAGYRTEQIEQVGKIDLFVQPLAVAVDVLPQQGDLLIALRHQLLKLRQNGGGFAAALPPAHIGYDAVGAEIIAAVHNGQPRAEARIAADGHFLDHGVALRRGFQIALAAAHALCQHSGQTVDAVHAEHQINIRVALTQLFNNVGLLRHTAADADHQAGVLLLELFQRTHVAENALLGVFAHSAGVEQNQVGVFNRIAQTVADILQNTADLFAVVDVLLAAVAAHIRQRRRFVVGSQRLGGILVVGIS